MRADLYWIEGPWRGRLALARRPRGGDWLEEEMQAWRASDIDRIVSFLTLQEEEDLTLTGEKKLAEASGIGFVSFPIPDRSVPADRDEARRLIRGMEKQLTEGKTIVLHCRQGLGRSALMAACLLVAAGVEPQAAFRRLGQARGCPVPETEDQSQWVLDFAHEIAPTQS